MAVWQGLKELIKIEIIQREEEGCNIEGLNKRLNSIEEHDKDKLMEVYNELMKLEVSKDFPYCEPTELKLIRELRNQGPRQLKITDSEKLKDNFYGAWLGRCIGCAFGQPLEITPFTSGINGRPGWKNVELWFKGADAWPIANYVPQNSRAEKEYGLFINQNIRGTLENIKFMPTDDDIRYTVLGLKLLEEKGLNWDSWDAGIHWLRNLQFDKVYTAERQAYLNFTNVVSYQTWDKEKWNAEWVRSHLNPFREWIGAQIRIDSYGYAAAGNPELAAELAWRDAAFSHVKNGVYGAMFFSAVLAAAFVEKDIDKLIEIGLSEIPNTSRLYHDIRKAAEIAKKAETHLELAENIYEEFKKYSAGHTINNAALCTAALVFSKGDFERAITTSVFGWDTDCNGATVGSIMGAIIGAENIPQKWSKPLNDTLYSEIPDFHPIAISECAERSYKLFRNIQNNI